jgi:hypothetical protein
MNARHYNPEGAPVTQCSDENSCSAVNCEVCLKEIPADAVKLKDAQDYVHHFCGLDCLEAWQKQAAIRQQSGPEKGPDQLK